MTIMHKETFDIYHNNQNLPDGCVEIDELIAPVIQVLNRKGYITRFCCSGHPVDRYLRTEEQKAKDTRDTYMDFISYIAFEEGITLPVLPSGFVVEPAEPNNSSSGLVAKKMYCIDNAFDNQVYERARSMLETMKQLYEWALDLPDFNS